MINIPNRATDDENDIHSAQRRFEYSNSLIALIKVSGCCGDNGNCNGLTPLAEGWISWMGEELIGSIGGNILDMIKNWI